MENVEKYLETRRLFLREINARDEQLIYELDGDPEVMKYLTFGKPSSLEEVRASLRRTEELLKKHNGRFGFWAAHEKRSLQFIGWFLFRPCKTDPENVKRIELGYRLLKRFWGQGYATEGSLALIEKGFNQLGVEEVFAVAMQKNLGSRKVMEKVGLKFNREFMSPDFPGARENDVEYSISKQAWFNRV